MARSPLAVRPLGLDAPQQLPPLLELDGESGLLDRLRRREKAVKQAYFWDLAARRAEQWSSIWTWDYSPHVRLTALNIA